MSSFYFEGVCMCSSASCSKEVFWEEDQLLQPLFIWTLRTRRRMKLRLLFVILLHVSQHASGVEVAVYDWAESVLLPCQVPADVSRGSSAAVWDRKEFNIPTVHVRLQSGDELEQQNDHYSERTSMRADALQTGDLSLTLRNPTVSDSGTYTCTTRRFGRDQTKTYVELKVKERPVWPIVVSVLLVLLVPVAIVFSVRLYQRSHQLQAVEAHPTRYALQRLFPRLFG